MANVNGGEVNVRVLSRRLVKASDEFIEPHVLAVSNLDLLPQSMQVSMFCIYPNAPSSAGFREHKSACSRYVVKTAVIGLGSPVVNVTAFSSFRRLDTDFGFGDAAMAMPLTIGIARVSSAFVQLIARPGGDGSWIASAYIWPRLAAALEAGMIFKPVTAEYLGLRRRDLNKISIANVDLIMALSRARFMPFQTGVASVWRVLEAKGPALARWSVRAHLYVARFTITRVDLVRLL